MKNVFSISLSNNSEDEILLQALTDDSAYSYLESISDDIFQLPEPTANFSLFELPEPDFQEPENPIEIKQRKPAKRQAGKLDNEERAKKIRKYLEKKRKRNWHKKINYNCRKKVADQRMRVKGRFVSKQQALNLGDTVTN